MTENDANQGLPGVRSSVRIRPRDGWRVARRLRTAGRTAMIYLPDSNAWVAYLRQNNPQLVQRFLQADPAEIALCSVVLAELLYGAHHSASNKRSANPALPSVSDV